MKSYLLCFILAAPLLSSCDTAQRINASTCTINRNTNAVECSTQAIYRNIEELEKIRAQRG